MEWLTMMHRDKCIIPWPETHTFRRRVGDDLGDVFQKAFDIYPAKLAQDVKFRERMESSGLTEEKFE